jgi:hypothetical protein
LFLLYNNHNIKNPEKLFNIFLFDINI